jgi:maltoporin
MRSTFTPTASFALKALALATAALASQAALALDYSGYFRAGPGLTTADNTARACYHLNEGAGNGIAHGLNYRLGNECDFYGEFQIDQKYHADGIEYSGTIMVNHYTNATDTNGNGPAFEQMFAEAKGFDIAPEATFWIGKQRGRRGDVHIVDWFFTDMKGVGTGMKGINVGSGKLGVAWYKTDGDSSATKPGNRLNAEWLGVDANTDGKINLFATVTKGQFSGGTGGYGLTLRHDQANLGQVAHAKISNTLWLQAAAGSTSLESNFGDLTRKASATSWRIVESINWQAGVFGGQAIALIGASEDNAGKKTTASTLGGRMSYGVTKNFKMVADLGFSQYKPEGEATARLTKFTLAPTLSINNEFWSRPELRLYVTTAKWSKGAGNVTGVTSLADKTSGTSAGAQVEWWF